MNFTFSVTKYGPKKLAGIGVKTTMEKASVDCPALWEKFGSRIGGDLAALRAPMGDTFGLSVMENDKGDFTYWAAIEIRDDAVLPADLTRLEIAKADYVCCAIPSLERIGAAYAEMYEVWPASQKDYEIDMQGACFERYAGDWTENDPIYLMAALTRIG